MAAVWNSVLEITKSAQENNVNPPAWAARVASVLNSNGLTLPSVDLAHVLVSHIFWDNHVPSTWKFLESAVTAKIIHPVILFALLPSRVIPMRRVNPVAFRLYLELLKRNVYSLVTKSDEPIMEEMMTHVDNTLRLSKVFGLSACDPWQLYAIFVFSSMWLLLDTSLDDEGLLELTIDKGSPWPILLLSQDMEIDGQETFDEQRRERLEELRKLNSHIGVEIIGGMLQDKVTSRVIYLARRNLPLQWQCFVQRVKILSTNSSVLRLSKYITPESILRLTSDERQVLSRESKTSSKNAFHAVTASNPLTSSAGQSHGASWSSLWLPIDIFLEDAMDGSQVVATSAVETLTNLVQALKAINYTTWHNTFLGLWIAALRLVQREKDPCEGPVPRLDTCLCMLLSITTLAIVNIIESEESSLADVTECVSSNQIKGQSTATTCREELISSLQFLGNFEGLLAAPQPLVMAANQAAAKAMLLVSGLAPDERPEVHDMPSNYSGNLRHLIVEACITRNLLDTSAYLWPGYVKTSYNQAPRGVTGEMLGWSSLMKGSPLTPSLINALISVPASSLAEIEKVHEIAVNGSNDDKIAAAKIICGATLLHGWNIQEHSVTLITRLLSSPDPENRVQSECYLIDLAVFLNVLILGIATTDNVQIFSLHGMVPQLAGALMPICEAFGSCKPTISWTLPTGEELTSHAIFSNAFTLLLKLWRFYQSPMEHVTGDVTPVGYQITPEYLLLIRNSQLAHSGGQSLYRSHRRLPSFLNPRSTKPLFMDFFPKLNCWYQQLQACIASTLVGLVPGTPVHQIVEKLLNMMFRKIKKDSQPLSPVKSGSPSLSGSYIGNDPGLNLQAWDILEAVPFALDAALTACAHGRLSPRELVTGLKSLADLLPASLATIMSYFSAEVTRGIWKPASMNGTDWPSPAANLAMVEQQIKQNIAATGVNVPSLFVGGSYPASIPLPLAALVSLTITYRLDGVADRFLYLVGPGLNALAASCPWPCMPIIAALWTQKARRWSDYLIFYATRTVFHHNRDAVVQLIKSCFTSILDLNSSHVGCGVGTLLGHGFGSHFAGGIAPVAPGILYLGVHRAVRDVMFLTEEMLSILMQSVGDIARSGLHMNPPEKLKKSKFNMKYGLISLDNAMTRIRLAASLGASIIWISGGLLLVQTLIKEKLPSWFISVHRLKQESVESTGMVAMLRGYALAYFAIMCGAFAWGVDSVSPSSRRRSKVLGDHLKFVASVIDGQISIGCDWATWRAYLLGFVSLMVACAPLWVADIDLDVLKRLSKGLMSWNEEELALALLGLGGVKSMGTAAKLIVENYGDSSTHCNLCCTVPANPQPRFL
uniref:Reduced epidermal fluorescence 4 n=2 Tax=Kalanchoe fedtschenkoi TaxID=63787 RepID=A0A7N0T3L3_KALFE